MLKNSRIYFHILLVAVFGFVTETAILQHQNIDHFSVILESTESIETELKSEYDFKPFFQMDSQIGFSEQYAHFKSKIFVSIFSDFSNLNYLSYHQETFHIRGPPFYFV